MLPERNRCVAGAQLARNRLIYNKIPVYFHGDFLLRAAGSQLFFKGKLLWNRMFPLGLAEQEAEALPVARGAAANP